jgi:diguanylate cyclase (GGDEF)-like protein
MGKILLVEDDKAQAKVTQDCLEKIGYDVICNDNGIAAIKTAKTQSIDLIILDLVLPDISGNEVCRWLKNNRDTEGIPIIMLTAQGSTPDKIAGLEAGAYDYLPKPYDEAELKARIYACLRTKALQDKLSQKNQQLEDLLSKVETLAITDTLTELFNRRHFEAVIEKEFERTKRYSHQTSCLLIDIDKFKHINDTYGHRIGDTVLQEIAQVFKKCVRKVDTVARWGGEEFIILLPETNKESALQVASRILTCVSEFKFSSLDEQLTISIGIATMPEETIDSSEQFINASDQALYKDKRKGRNRLEAI